jgi:ribonuclease III
MNDDQNNPIETAPKTDELSLSPKDSAPESLVPEAAPETAAAKKKRNRAAAKAAAAEIETRIGHSFKDPLLLATAFTHVSALKSQRSRAESYQRLEFLGDHVLGLVVSDMLYRAFPAADEGELSQTWRVRSGYSKASSSARSERALARGCASRCSAISARR